MVDLSNIPQPQSWDKEFEQRLADLEARVAAQDHEIKECRKLYDALLMTCEVMGSKLAALEAKPKGNKQGYPREGVKWDGKVRLLAKQYGYDNSEIDDMQESMDNHFLSKVGTSKAVVSSDWQLNARTWIKNQAKYDGRTRQNVEDSGTERRGEFSKRIKESLRRVIPDLTDAEFDEMNKYLRLVPSQIDVARDQMGMYWRDYRDDLVRAGIKAGIGKERFAWPAIKS